MTANSLVLLHGFTGSGANWAAHSARFQAAGLRVLAPDLPGHGANLPVSSDDYTMEAAAAQIAGLLEQEESGPVHLLGYSMGGRLALYFALHHPTKVRSLILESGAGDRGGTGRAPRQRRRPGPSHRAGRHPRLCRFLGESAPLEKSGESARRDSIVATRKTPKERPAGIGRESALDGDGRAAQPVGALGGIGDASAAVGRGGG